MKETDYRKYIIETIEFVIRCAEKKCGHQLSRRFVFRNFWKQNSDERPIAQEDVVDYLFGQTWINENEIYPCYDLGVANVLQDGTLVLSGTRAGFAPGPWQKNWTGREGPFVPVVIGTWWQKGKMTIVQATERFSKVEFQADQDWNLYPQAVYTCPHCIQEIVFNMSHFAEGAFQYFSNLSENDARQFDEAIPRTNDEHNSFLDFYCPGCKAPVRVYYLVWAGGRFTHGYRFHIVAEGNP